MKLFSKKRKSAKTYTKQKLDLILGVALVDMQFPFILAFLGKNEIAETLAVAIVTEIIGVMLGYYAKSYFETKEEKKNEMLLSENVNEESEESL